MTLNTIVLRCRKCMDIIRAGDHSEMHYMTKAEKNDRLNHGKLRSHVVLIKYMNRLLDANANSMKTKTRFSHCMK